MRTLHARAQIPPLDPARRRQIRIQVSAVRRHGRREIRPQGAVLQRVTIFLLGLSGWLPDYRYAVPAPNPGGRPLVAKKLLDPLGRTHDVIPAICYRLNDFINGNFFRVKSDSGDMGLVIDHILQDTV